MSIEMTRLLLKQAIDNLRDPDLDVDEGQRKLLEAAAAYASIVWVDLLAQAHLKEADR